MTEPLQVGQFAIVDGEPVDRGPNAGVFRGKGPSDDRAELFLLAEGTTPAGEAFAGHVISDLGQTFASLDMSLTGSLGRLFLEAERNLKDWNRKSIVQHRVSIGLSAFGKRGEQAVIAQAGPTVAFHFHQGHMTEYFTEGDHARPIGVAPVQPQLTRINFDDGDRLLLISSHAMREVDSELIAGILALPVEQVLPDLYRRVAELRQVTAVLVTGPSTAPDILVEEPIEVDDGYVIGEDTASSGTLRDSNFQPSLFIEDESESVVLSARSQLMEITPRRSIDGPVHMPTMDAPTPLLRASGDSAASITRLAAEGAARAARSRAAVATIEAEANRADQEPYRPAWHDASLPAGPVGQANEPVGLNGEDPHVVPNGRPRKAQSFSRGLVPNETPRARPELLTEDLPLVAELAAGQRAKASRANGVPAYLPAEDTAEISGGAPLVRPRSNMGGRWKGEGSIGKRTMIGGQLPPAWMVILAGLILLVVVAGFATVPQLLDGDDQAQVATLLQGAQERIAASNNQTDPAQKRQMLSEAQAMLLDVRDRGTSPQTEELISQVAGVISEMDNIKEPAAVETIASLERFGTKPVAVGRMVVAADSAFLLDVNSSQVVAVPLGGGEPKVVYSESKDEKRAKPVAIAQLDDSSTGSPVLLISDASNKLWALSGSGIKSIGFAAPGNLAISDVAVFGAELFVLDSSQSTIYRFAPTLDGFSDAPSVALKNPDLSTARRLMVDGEYITSDANGTIHRFIPDPQTAITFSQAGIDRRLVAPETAQRFGGGAELAILDAPNDRIVVLRRDGGFDRQYRHPDFASASAFAVRGDEAFIFSGAQLRRIVF